MLEHGGRLRKAALHYGIAEADWLDLSTGLCRVALTTCTFWPTCWPP